MIRVTGKYRIRIPNRVAVVAALVLAVTALVGLGGKSLTGVEQDAPTLLRASSEVQAVEEETKPVRKFSLLLFRHG